MAIQRIVYPARERCGSHSVQSYENFSWSRHRAASLDDAGLDPEEPGVQTRTLKNLPDKT